ASVKVIETFAAEEGSYSLRLDTTLSVEAVRPEVPNRWITELVKHFSELARHQTPVRAMARTDKGAFLVRHENGADWGYLCVSWNKDGLAPESIKNIYDIAVGEGTGVHKYNGSHILCKFKMGEVDYHPLQHVMVVLDHGNYSVNLYVTALIEYYAPGVDHVTPSRYLNPPGKVSKSDICRIVYRADGKKPDIESASSDFDLAKGVQQTKFSSLVNVGQMSEWPDENQTSHTMTLKVGAAERHWQIQLYKQPGSETGPAEWVAKLAEVTPVKTTFIGETAE
ncbi:hypothetical protein WCE02_24080, partial [Pseudomonas juntendi]|uniref:hypothetical protein n=3 Tax=Pseudomonas TaxID=286 RepID=UPI0034D52A8C